MIGSVQESKKPVQSKKEKVCSTLLAYLGCQHRHFPTLEEAGKRTSGGVRYGEPFAFPAHLPCCAENVIHLACRWNGSSKEWNKAQADKASPTEVEMIGLTKEYTREKS